MPTKSLTVRRLHYVYNYSSVGTNPLALTSSSTGEYAYVDQFTGVSNPSWRSQIADGSNATTVASGNRATIKIGFSRSSSKVRRLFDGQVSNWYSEGAFQPDLLVSASLPGNKAAIDQDVANKALIGFLKKCKGVQRQFSGGVFLGELRQTIQLVRSPLQGLRSAFNRWHGWATGRVRQGNPSTLSRDFSNQWLEFQFGVKPLISDLGNGVEALERLKGRRFRKKLRFLSKDEVIVSTNAVQATSYAIPLTYCGERQMKYRSFNRFIGEVHCEPDGPLARAEALGLGLRDFVPTIYELIPYSFLVDYFVNFGELIDAWSFNQADLAWHNQTIRNESVVDVKLFPGIPNSGAYEILSSYQTLEPSSRTDVTFVRRRDPLGFPSLAFRLPGTSTKFINIAALARLRVPG